MRCDGASGLLPSFIQEAKPRTVGSRRHFGVIILARFGHRISHARCCPQWRWRPLSRWTCDISFPTVGP